MANLSWQKGASHAKKRGGDAPIAPDAVYSSSQLKALAVSNMGTPLRKG